MDTLQYTNAGVGFKTSQTYNNVPLYAITGNGQVQLQQLHTNSSGQVSSISLTSNTGGSGYVVGDVLGITTSNVTKVQVMLK